MVNNPISANAPTKITDSISEPEAYSFDFVSALLPCSFPIIADVPIPKPIFKLITVNVTGKVKLIAASWSVPNKLTKNVSINPKLIIITMPKIIGMVIFRSVELIFPSSKSEERCVTLRLVTKTSVCGYRISNVKSAEATRAHFTKEHKCKRDSMAWLRLIDKRNSK